MVHPGPDFSQAETAGPHSADDDLDRRHLRGPTKVGEQTAEVDGCGQYRQGDAARQPEGHQPSRSVVVPGGEHAGGHQHRTALPVTVKAPKGMERKKKMPRTHSGAAGRPEGLDLPLEALHAASPLCSPWPLLPQ